MEVSDHLKNSYNDELYSNNSVCQNRNDMSIDMLMCETHDMNN